MGRKSTPRHRSKLHCLSMVNLNKSDIKRKRSMNKTKKSIRKLFHQLRHDGASNSTLENTVIEVDSSIQTPKIKNTYKQDGNLIIIGDDDDLVVSNEPCPLQCSTPINKSKSNLTPPNNTNNVCEDVINLTKEFNKDSYLTIDLTNESLNVTNPSQNTVIDLANTSRISFSNDSLSMSGDSDVTVINTKRKNKSNSQMQKFANGIAKMNSSERGKLLEFIAQKIFNGCNGPKNTNNSLHSLKLGLSKSTETAEDTYIKEVILGQATSRNSIGSNIYNPEREIKNKSGLRMIVIDGSNVAMQHSKGRVFSVKALKICIDYFVRRGHIVKAFVPRFRCKYGKSTDGKLLDQLERQGLVVYTPSREVQGRMITSYDDRYIVQCAAEFDGVIVSGDNYRDLLSENPRWRNVIENRLLQFTWVDDMVMFPKDPLGRHGPTLEQFLKHPA